MILALIIAVPALITAVARPGAGAIWSQLSALVLMASAGLVGQLGPSQWITQAILQN